MYATSYMYIKVARTLDFPFRHCTQATATACRFLRLSGAGRRCPGSSEAGAMLCHRSESSMPWSLGWQETVQDAEVDGSTVERVESRQCVNVCR
jgi:hypothetical protein